MAEAAPPSYDLTKTASVDWNTVSEKWEMFKLSDGVKLKGRLVITGFRRSEERQASGEPHYSWASTNLFTLIECPSELKGNPTQPPPTPQQVSDPANGEETVDFESTSRPENWNIYNLADGTIIRLRLIVQQISRTRFRDLFGEPIYGINSQTVHRVTVAKNLVVKPKPRFTETEPGKPYG